MTALEPSEIDGLLRSVEPLAYPLRMRELALYARRKRGTPEFAEVLSALSARGAYERRTALHLAMAARDIPFLEGVLAGDDMVLRRAALRAVRKLPVSDEAAALVLEDAPRSLRTALYRALGHGRRTALADRLLPRVRETWGDREAASLLPACSEAVAAEALPSLAHATGLWSALVRRHPAAVMAVLEAEVAGDHPGLWWRRRSAIVADLAEILPGRSLDLVSDESFFYIRRRLPARAIRAMTRADEARASVVFGDVGFDPRDFLLDVAPSARDAAFDVWLAERGAHQPHPRRVLPAMSLLSTERAAREARRLLDWHASVWHSSRGRLDDPNIPLELTAFLPWAEASQVLTEAAFGGDPRRRGLARRLLLECAARTGDRALLTAQFDAVARRVVNDADPLRAAFFEALALLPLPMLDQAWSGQLDIVATAAVRGRDASAATGCALRDFASRVLRHTDGALAAWALGVPGLLLRRFAPVDIGLSDASKAPETPRSRRRRRSRGAGWKPTVWRLDTVLRPGQERDLVTRLPLDDDEVAVAIGRSLGRRAWALAEVQEALHRVARKGGTPELAAAAVGLWLADPATRVQRAVELAQADPAALAMPSVWRTVAGRRADLLAALPVAAEWLPLVTPELPGRWTPAYRDRVLEFAAVVVEDDDHLERARAEAVRAFGLVARACTQGAVTDHLDRLVAWAGSSDPLVAEAALRELGRSTAPDTAVAALLDLSRGPYSAAVVAALAAAADETSPSILGPRLTAALAGDDTKITVRKTAARLLRRTRVAGHLDVLVEQWSRPELHPDVRVAIAVQFRTAYEDPRALTALLHSPDRSELMIRTLYQPQPFDFPPAARGDYARLIYRLLRDSTDPGVRFRGGKAFHVWARWYSDGLDELVATLHDGGPADRAWALEVVLALIRADALGDRAPGVLARLAADPGRHRDVGAVARALGSAGDGTARHGRLVREALAVLSDVELLRPAAVRLAIAMLPSGEPATKAGVDPAVAGATAAEWLSTIADLLADRPMLAGDLAHEMTRRLGRHGQGIDDALLAALLPAAEALAARGEPVAGLLAARLATLADRHTGFVADWLGLVDVLRASRHVEVRQAAADLIQGGEP